MDDSAQQIHIQWQRLLEQWRQALQTPIEINVQQIVGGGQPLTRVNDTNVTGTLTGTPLTALLKPVTLTLGWTGTLAATRLNANVVQAVTNDTNVTGVVAAQVLTLGWTGTLGVARGGTGTGTAFTPGSIVFAGASGIYTQDNANLFYDDTNNRVGIGTATPERTFHVKSSGNGFVVESTFDAVIGPIGIIVKWDRPTPAVGDDLVGVNWQFKSSTGLLDEYAEMTSVLRNNTVGSETADVMIACRASGASPLYNNAFVRFRPYGTGSAGIIRFGAGEVESQPNPTIGGGFLYSSSASQGGLTGGAEYTGATFTARGSTTASIFELLSGGANWYGDTGLTNGVAFTPTRLMTLTSAGSLGLGTASPDGSLHVKNPLSVIHERTTGQASFVLANSNASIAALDVIGFLGGRHSAAGSDYAALKLIYESANNGAIGFFTMAASVAAERMHITSAGAITMTATLDIAGIVTAAAGFVGPLTGAVTGNLSGQVSTPTQNSITSIPNLATVGALNSGSITSGFGAIDVGADSVTAGSFIGPGTALTGVDLLASVNTHTAFGAHTWSSAGTGGNSIAVGNTTGGTGNFARFTASNDLGVTTALYALSSTYTTSGAFIANSAVLEAARAGGLSLNASAAASTVRLYGAGTLALTALSTGITIPGTLDVTGVGTFTAQPIMSSLTASRAVFTDGSKGLVSNAITGSGNVVMSASPTLTGTIGCANMTLSGTLDVTGDFKVNTNKFTVAATSGNTLVAGTLSVTSTVALTAKVSTYNNIITAGWGVATIQAYARQDNATGAVTSLTTYSPSAADGTFAVSANVLVTTSTTHNFSVQVTYTDESSTARTLTLPVAQLAGTFVTAITNVTGAGPYEGIPLHIRVKAATTITIKTAGTFTTVNYNVDGFIVQLA